MANYAYSDGPAGRRSRSVEKFAWIIMGVTVTALLLATFHPAVQKMMRRTPGGFLAVLVIMYLLFLVVTRRVFRQQRVARVSVVTTRRGFTYRDEHDRPPERIQSWRDVRESAVHLDVDSKGRVFVKRIVLSWPRPAGATPTSIGSTEKVQLVNDPNASLPHIDTLVTELLTRIPHTRFFFHWYHYLCPFCRGSLEPRGKQCGGCGRAVTCVSKILRPWEMIREEALYIFLLLLVAGPRFFPLALAFVCGATFLTLLANAPPRMKLLVLASGEDDIGPLTDRADATAEDELAAGTMPASTPADAAPEPRGVGGAKGRKKKGNRASSIFLGALLIALSCRATVAAPSPSPAGSVSPSPASSASPSPSVTSTSSPLPLSLPGGSTQTDVVADQAFFPLAVGDTWEYRSNYNVVLMKVTGTEIVNGAKCYIVTSWVGTSRTSVQAEYFASTPQCVEVYKRRHKGSEFFLDSPEAILRFPLQPGRHWTWQGNADEGNVWLVFTVVGPRPVRVLGQLRESQLILIRGRSSDGSEIQTKRWYCQGIGMVREQTMMKKGGKALSIEATLSNYSLRAPLFDVQP